MKRLSFRYAGLAALLIEYSAFAYFVLIAKQSLSLAQTISDFGTFKSTQVAFSIVFTVIGILVGLFGIWLANKLMLSRVFLVVLYSGAIAQIGIAWFPAQNSTQMIHYLFATILVIAEPWVV